MLGTKECIVVAEQARKYHVRESDGILLIGGKLWQLSDFWDIEGFHARRVV